MSSDIEWPAGASGRLLLCCQASPGTFDLFPSAWNPLVFPSRIGPHTYRSSWGRFALNVDVSDSVATVKARIHNVTGITIEAQNLFLHDEKLVGTESLSSYGIGDGATLEMLLPVTIRFPTMVPQIAT